MPNKLDELAEMIENPKPLIDQVVRDLCALENRSKSATRRIITHLIEVRDETWQERNVLAGVLKN